jgi:hypothetical protein
MDGNWMKIKSDKQISSIQIKYQTNDDGPTWHQNQSFMPIINSYVNYSMTPTSILTPWKTSQCWKPLYVAYNKFQENKEQQYFSCLWSKLPYFTFSIKESPLVGISIHCVWQQSLKYYCCQRLWDLRQNIESEMRW